MINRVKDRLGEEPEEEGPECDYWRVSARSDWFFVPAETAERIIEELGRQRPPRWIRFTDLFGSEVSVRSRDIEQVAQSTGVQRVREREFRRARHREEKADRRPWEDDDWLW